MSERNRHMPFYDNEILIQNINDLMRNNGMTQVQLAEILGMSQSNVSKALSLRDKKSFTLDQVAGIAQHFNVSVDSLLGHKQEALNPKSQTDVARFVADLLANGTAKYKSINVEEDVYVGSYDNQAGFYSYELTKKTNEYTAIYFPNYHDLPTPKHEFDEEAFDVHYTARIRGNETDNFQLNEFLIRFLKILEVYKTNDLDRETFDRIVDSYVEKMTED